MVQMIKLWGKIIKSNKIIDQIEAICNEDIEYQQQLKACITEICNKLDIEKPYWLPKNLEEYNKRKRTSFLQDNFIEEINFDTFEIEVLEEK
jgi:tetrahydromethanopterin S-methyltransferase subunit A